jgi:site-specific DNA recombinase
VTNADSSALRRLEAADGVLVSVRDSLDTSSPMGRFARTMMLAIAELELDRIRENWQVGREHVIGRGVQISAVAAAGYKRSDSGRLELDPVAAPVIRELFLRRAAGASWTSLCEFLDERLAREDGKLWRNSTVLSIMKLRVYLGEAAAGSVVNPDGHPAIVSRAEWEAAQSVPRLQATHKGEGSLLAGLACCGGCGRPTNSGDGYRCQGRHSAHGDCPAKTKVTRAGLDAFVEEAFLARLAAEPVIAVEGAAPDQGLTDALAQLDAAEAELGAYRDANLISVIGRQAYVDGLASRAGQVEQARDQVAHRQRAQKQGRARVELTQTWPTLSLPEKRALLAEVLHSLVITSAPQQRRRPRLPAPRTRPLRALRAPNGRQPPKTCQLVPLPLRHAQRPQSGRRRRPPTRARDQRRQSSSTPRSTSSAAASSAPNDCACYATNSHDRQPPAATSATANSSSSPARPKTSTERSPAKHSASKNTTTPNTLSSHSQHTASRNSARRSAITSRTHQLEAAAPTEPRPEEIEALLDSIPDLTSVMQQGTPDELRELFAAFDLTATNNQQGRSLQLTATLSPALVHPEPVWDIFHSGGTIWSH